MISFRQNKNVNITFSFPFPFLLLFLFLFKITVYQSVFIAFVSKQPPKAVRQPLTVPDRNAVAVSHLEGSLLRRFVLMYSVFKHFTVVTYR